MMTRGFIHLELKGTATDSGRFTGRAAVYNAIDQGGDKILPSAFAASLQKRGNVRPLLWSHNPEDVIGTGTFTDGTDALQIDGALDLNVARAKEALSLMKSGAVSGLSIGFMLPQDGYSMEGSTRVLKTIDLIETSLVAFPMQDAARVMSVKSSIGTLRDFERFLREAGWSKREAMLLASGGWKSMSSDSPEDELLEGLRALNTAA